MIRTVYTILVQTKDRRSDWYYSSTDQGQMDILVQTKDRRSAWYYSSTDEGQMDILVTINILTSLSLVLPGLSYSKYVITI